MFQSFRNQKRLWALLAMILVIPAFVFIGINGYSRLNPDANAIAKLDGSAIQPEEFDAAKRNYIERMRIQEGGTIDASLFDTPEANAAILYNLTTEKALGAQLRHNHIGISDGDAIAYIKQAAAFQKEGKFDPELYSNYLAARGKSDSQFVYELKGELAREMLINAVSRTVTVPEKTLELINGILNEERTVRTLVFDPTKYLDKVSVTEDQIKKFYEDNQESFRVPQMLDIEYVVFSPDTVKVTEEPSKALLEQFYEQNKLKFGQEETRRASHILIQPDENETDRTKADEEAKAKAEEIFEKAKANPDSFAELAKEYSADTGSALNGGDLDYFSAGQMVPEFDKAVFEAKKGDIIGPIKTEFGYHIIKVTDVVPAHIRTFEEVEPEIRQIWETQQKQSIFAENADNFTNMVYEQSDSLEPVIEKFGLQVHKLSGLTENGFVDRSNETPFITKRVISELFSPDCLNDKRNTQAIEIGNNTIVSARVDKNHPAAIKPYDEIKNEVKTKLELEKASELAKADGEVKLKELQANSNLDGFDDQLVVSRSKPMDQSIELINAEMQVPADKLPSFVGATVENGDYVISYVESSRMPTTDAASFNELKNEVTLSDSMGEELAYYDALKELYKLRILKTDYDFKLPPALQ